MATHHNRLLNDVISQGFGIVTLMRDPHALFRCLFVSKHFAISTAKYIYACGPTLQASGGQAFEFVPVLTNAWRRLSDRFKRELIAREGRHARMIITKCPSSHGCSIAAACVKLSDWRVGVEGTTMTIADLTYTHALGWGLYMAPPHVGYAKESIILSLAQYLWNNFVNYCRHCQQPVSFNTVYETVLKNTSHLGPQRAYQSEEWTAEAYGGLDFTFECNRAVCLVHNRGAHCDARAMNIRVFDCHVSIHERMALPYAWLGRLPYSVSCDEFGRQRALSKFHTHELNSCLGPW